MRTLYLFDLGSTKSSLAFADDSEDNSAQLKTFSGFNPNRPNSSFFQEIKEEIGIAPHDKVVVYGSGLANSNNKQKVKDSFFKMFDVRIDVYDDILGAAHALFGDEEGLLAILGTGGCSAYYNGNKIEKRSGGYGYLIDDLGGGIELGRLIMSKWLNNELPDVLAQEIREYWDVSVVDFTTKFYQNVDLQKLAGVCEIVHDYRKLPIVNALLISYFDLFFNRHILKMADDFEANSLGIVGSIGFAFQDEIKEIGAKYAIKIGIIIKHPIHSLYAYHSLKLQNEKTANK